MSIDVSKFRGSIQSGYLCKDAEICDGIWPENLSGHVFIVAPYHRENDRHLFAGEGVIIRWDLQAENNRVKVHSKKLKTWDSFWRKVLPIFNLLKGFLPAVISPLGVSEIANTAIVKIVTKDDERLDERLILTADAGRYWEVDPKTLKTITPIGYFDQHIVAIPLLFFPLVENTAHPFYDKDIKKLITCELKSKLVPGKIFRDMISDVYITCWDGQKTIEHWKLNGIVLDGSPHTTIVTEDYIMIPDMPFQIGVAKLLGLNIPSPDTYPKTQIHLVKRKDLNQKKEHIPSQLVTFPGDSYHFLVNYYHIDGEIICVAIQQATISLTETIRPDDIKHFSGEAYSKEYIGIPWMFGFDPGVLRKVVIKDAQLIREEAFIHPGWFSTTLYTADPREFSTPEGYSAIYQVYAGYHRDLICRRQYLSFRDHENRILTDKQLPQKDLPSVLAKVPLDKDWQKLREQLDQNWQELRKQIETEQEQNPDTYVDKLVNKLAEGLLDFYVYPKDYLLVSIQFIPQDKGYIFTTVLTPENQKDEAWLFAADNLSQGPVAKLRLSEDVHFGFTLHSEYFKEITSPPAPSPSQVNRICSALRSLTVVPWEFFFGSPAVILNRRVRK